MQQVTDNTKAVSNVCGLSSSNYNVSKAESAINIRQMCVRACGQKIVDKRKAVSNACGLSTINYNVSKAEPAHKM